MKPLLAVLKRQKTEKVPLWLMRQAGRYLPEYREVRSRSDSFNSMIYSPELAAEVTLQPVRRFGMDGAVIFSDILTIPDAMGRSLFFDDNGPGMNPVESDHDISLLSPEVTEAKLSPVYEAVEMAAGKLSREGFTDTALIGFAGSPWTMACYMIEGRSSRDFIKAKLWSYQRPESFYELIRKLEKAVVIHLSAQIKAGAEVVQLFDSHAGLLDAARFQSWVIEPARRITDKLKELHPEVPVIGFPKGAGQLYQKYARESGVTAVSVDSGVSALWAARFLQPELVVQGNLDSVCLLAGGDALELETESILGNLSGGPFIFNLGHGVHKDTPVEHVGRLCEIVRSWTV